MAFDPFGDYETRGYLQNIAATKDPNKLKALEHAAFARNFAKAATALQAQDVLTLQSVNDTHKNLFKGVYPTWAGKDRSQTSPDLTIRKGRFVTFANPDQIAILVNRAFQLGETPELTRKNVGSIMGALADAHPFLDGNGRTIMTVHSEMMRRAGIHIDWSKTNKKEYLAALTDEIAAPERGYLDNYLKPFVVERTLSIDEMRSQLTVLKGLSKPDEVAPAQNLQQPQAAPDIKSPTPTPEPRISTPAEQKAISAVSAYLAKNNALDEREIVAIRSGDKVSGDLVAKGNNLFMLANADKIQIGNMKDLPEGAKVGQNIGFEAKSMIPDLKGASKAKNAPERDFGPSIMDGFSGR